MEVAELSALNTSKAGDFEIQRVLGAGQNGLVVSAKCTRTGLPDKRKLYAVKLLFNFTHEYTSVVRNAYENEWLILSRLLPHENMVRFWSQFISPIPETFSALLPDHVKKHATRRNKAGEIIRSKGQFLVLDYHPMDLEKWVGSYPAPMQFELLLTTVEQIMEAVIYLEKNFICHLDLKLSNFLVAENNRVVLCDFGCAVQFSDSSFNLPYSRGMLPGGNKAHLAPEILNTYHKLRRNPTSRGVLNYTKQESFAVGVLVHELAMREHPLSEYPLGCTRSELVLYDSKEIPSLAGSYPKSFSSIVSDLLVPDPSKRLSMQEALTQLRVCCIKSKEREPASYSLQTELENTRRERDLAKTKLQVVATERDFAVSQMKEMAEQVQSIAGEFKSMADHCARVMKELEQVRKEKDSAVRACESAYEAGELLKEQLALLKREKDVAETQVEELRDIISRRQVEESIKECSCCRGFYMESSNSSDACHYHSGKYLHKRWSCCYKSDEKSTGCKSGKHIQTLS